MHGHQLLDRLLDQPANYVLAHREVGVTDCLACRSRPKRPKRIGGVVQPFGEAAQFRVGECPGPASLSSADFRRATDSGRVIGPIGCTPIQLVDSQVRRSGCYQASQTGADHT